MEDLHNVSLELVRDILDLAENTEAAEAADSERVMGKAEESIEVHGAISAFFKVEKLQIKLIHDALLHVGS